MRKQTSAADSKGSCRAANIIVNVELILPTFAKIPLTSAQQLVRKAIVGGVIRKISVHIPLLLIPLNLLLDLKTMLKAMLAAYIASQQHGSSKQ